jgi:uncharacterized protein YjbJ (UPF0337 family)
MSRNLFHYRWQTHCHLKRKKLYASPIIPGSWQRHRDWWRLGRSYPPDCRGGFVAPLNNAPFRRDEQRNSISQTIMTTLEIKGDWNITKGKLKQRWAKLTDNDLQYIEGKQEELLGRIQKVTGETREAVEKAITESTSCGCE